MFPGSDGGGAQSLDEIAQIYIDSLREDAKSRPDRWQGAAAHAKDGGKPSPLVGDLWLTGGSFDDPPALVVITWVGEGVHRAVVTLDEPELAASEDILLAAEQSVLGIPLALCAWRDLPVAETDLRRLVGSLPDSIVEPLAMLLQNALTGGFQRRALGFSRLSSGEAGVRWTIEASGENGHAVEYLSGAPIRSESDPRLRVRQEILHFTAYLEHRALRDATAHAEPAEGRAGIAQWLKSLVPADWFPEGFQSPRLAFMSIDGEYFAAADSGGQELVVEVAPGQSVVLHLDADGRGEIINEVTTFENIAVVLASRRSNRVIPMGHRGYPAEPALLLSRDRRHFIWYDKDRTEGELILGVFVAQ